MCITMQGKDNEEYAYLLGDTLDVQLAVESSNLSGIHYSSMGNKNITRERSPLTRARSHLDIPHTH